MGQTPIYTIGYGAREIDAFVGVLKANDVAFLIDVRSKPYSHYKPEFSKAALEQRLKAEGIRYVFMGDTLGGQPDDPACKTNDKVDYEKIREMPFYQAGIGRLHDAWQQQLRVAIMCSEGRPEQCHRSNLIADTLIARDINVIHIDENDQLITQAEVMVRLHDGQPSLFGAEFTRSKSRKRYRVDGEGAA
jgi:uncharacterized protein (DUF488 family)